jgi:hypothetical protein
MMKYRGVTYSVENPSVDMIETNCVGHYRGQSYPLLKLSHLPVPQPILRMTYRGVPYETTAMGGVAPSIATGAIPRTAAQRQETQQVHRHHLLNLLQHRLDVARGKGDTGLVQQLEQEMRVLQ